MRYVNQLWLITELIHITHALCESTLIIIRVDSHNACVVWINSDNNRVDSHNACVMWINSDNNNDNNASYVNQHQMRNNDNNAFLCESDSDNNNDR